MGIMWWAVNSVRTARVRLALKVKGDSRCACALLQVKGLVYLIDVTFLNDSKLTHYDHNTIFGSHMISRSYRVVINIDDFFISIFIFHCIGMQPIGSQSIR